MGTLSPTITIKDPKSGHGGGVVHPPISGGGDDSRGGNGSPDYGQRLRRARLGLLVALAPIIMLFVSFTSAYIVRQGLPTLDERTGTYVRDWLQVNLPTALLLVNTLLLIVSSITMELSRRKITREVALAPVKSIPGVSVEEGRGFPWLGSTVVVGVAFIIGQWMAWRELAARGFFLATRPNRQ